MAQLVRSPTLDLSSNLGLIVMGSCPTLLPPAKRVQTILNPESATHLYSLQIKPTFEPQFSEVPNIYYPSIMRE